MADTSRQFVRVTNDPLDLNQLASWVGDSAAGAIATFSGVTRDTFDGKNVVKLEYEAYIPMAEKKLAEVCATARQKWDIIKIAIEHRLGVVAVTETSVIIAVSSAHRREALEVGMVLYQQPHFVA